MRISIDSNIGGQLYAALCKQCRNEGISIFDLQAWINSNDIKIKLIYDINPKWGNRLRKVNEFELPNNVEDQTQILLTWT